MKAKWPFLFLYVLLMSACEEPEDASPDPTLVRISWISVNTMPLTDGGTSWDVGGDADVYVQVERSSSGLYKSAVFKDNVQAADLPLRLQVQPSYLLPAMNQVYRISVYDYDQTSADDVLGAVSFNPEDFKKQRPASRIFQGNDVQVQVSFNWE